MQRRLALPVGYCSSAHGLPGPGSHWQANRCPGPGRLSLSGRCQKSVSWSVTQSHGCPLAQSFSGSPACHRGSRRGGPGSLWRPVTAALIDRVSSYWQLESQVFKFLRWPKQTCPGLTGSSDYLNLASSISTRAPSISKQITIPNASSCARLLTPSPAMSRSSHVQLIHVSRPGHESSCRRCQ